MNDPLIRADELTRRRFIARTASSLLGVGLLPGVFTPRALAAAAAKGGTAKNVIFLYMDGGMSHLDTLDPKQGEVAGPVRAIKTSADGVLVSERVLRTFPRPDCLSWMARKSYPSDATDEEWAFVVPYLVLMKEDAPQREYALREVFNGLRWIVRAGASWRMMPNDLPPWHVVYDQTQRWFKAGVFEALVNDLRTLLRLAQGRAAQPTAAVMDSRTLHGSIESGARAGYDGHKKKKGSKLHLAVDTLGNLLAAHVTPANEQERGQVGELAAAVQQATGESVQVAFVDQGYTGEEPAGDAAAHGVRLEVVKHSEAKRGFVLLPRRWVVERSFAWTTRFRRLVRDYERLPATLAGLHFVTFATVMLSRILSIAIPQSA